MKLRKAVKKFFQLLNHAELFLLAYVCLTLAVMVVFAAVGRRFGFSGMFWLEELSRHTLIFITFLAASFAVKFRRHPAMTALENRLSGRKRHILIGLRSLSGFLFFLWLDYYAWSHVFRFRQLGVRTSTTGIPFYFIYSAIAVFCMFIFLRYLLATVKEFQALVKTGSETRDTIGNRGI